MPRRSSFGKSASRGNLLKHPCGFKGGKFGAAGPVVHIDPSTLPAESGIALSQQAPPKSLRPTAAPDWRGRCAALLEKHGRQLTRWEAAFVSGFGESLTASDKQIAKLNEIVARLATLRPSSRTRHRRRKNQRPKFDTSQGAPGAW
jgi:hypothetical protein